MIGVAIIGAGIGQQHLRAYLRLPQSFNVHILCDLDTKRARDVLEAESCTTHVEREVETVLGDPDIDLIDICLPPHLHFEMARRALEAGKHVICEKPLVTSLADADRLQTVVETTGRHLFPVFQYRFGRAMSQLKALERAGLLGAPVQASLETHWNRDAAYYAVDWRGTWAGEHGGAVLTHAIHSHDLLCHLFGPVAQVSAFCRTLVNPIEVEDCAAITFQMANGALATSSVTLGAAGDTSRLRLVYQHLTAESGSAPYTPAEDIWSFTARDPGMQARVDEITTGVANVPGGFTGFLEGVAGTFERQSPPPVTLADARLSLELVTAIYLSAREARPVTLPLPKDGALYEGWGPPPKL